MRGACIIGGLLGLYACSGSDDGASSAGSPHGAVATLPQDAASRELVTEWSSLAAPVPDDAHRLRGRIDALRSEPQPVPGVDLDAADAALRQATALFSKSQAAFAAGNMREAVRTAKTTQAQLNALAMRLQVPVAAPPVTPAAPLATTAP